MNIGWIDLNVGKLKKAEWNYKTDDDKKKEILKNNIKRNGYIQNIIIRELDTGKYEVVNGNHRLDVIKELKISDIHCYNLGKISKLEAQRIAIETNETYFENDVGRFNALLKELSIEYTVEALQETIPLDNTYFDSIAENIDIDAFYTDIENLNTDTETLNTDTDAKLKISDVFEKYGIKMITLTQYDRLDTLFNIIFKKGVPKSIDTIIEIIEYYNEEN